MQVTEISVDQLIEASWNPNCMTLAMADRLNASISRFGLVENLVVRRLNQHRYEVLSGNQRFASVRAFGFRKVPCVVVEADDTEARLLAEAFNKIEGEDDPGLRAELMREVLTSLSEEEVLSVLPETHSSIRELVSFGLEDVASGLAAWQKAQTAKLEHMTLQFTAAQRSVVEEAITLADGEDQPGGSNPNARSNSIYSICRSYLEANGDA